MTTTNYFEYYTPEGYKSDDGDEGEAEYDEGDNDDDCNDYC